ncbi:hypothetical protein N7447_002340 [Penicillium robsamsonii]|uniref:uncharacterized protein n=1 Tax=Penicillium robsamsonii TaxID=1792511 RepID=UPI002546CA7A|nr:uncharacterized protein N7447_002340 [Penicillium robsamsonii]KAJ5836314.1 hypothetical protein N7447_002340 [Penicillium robsamsonii]
MSKFKVSRLYDSFGYFTALDEYSEDGARLFEHSKGLLVDMITLSNIMLVENYLRETAQRIDYLERKMWPMQKIECSKDELSKLQRYEKEIEELKRTFIDMEISMFRAETLLPEKPLKRTYDKIRQKPACKEWMLQ